MMNAREAMERLNAEAGQLNIWLRTQANELTGKVNDYRGGLIAALKAEIGEWKERCAFEQAAFDGALVPQRAFR